MFELYPLPVEYTKQSIGGDYYVINGIRCKRVTSLITYEEFPKLHAAWGILKSKNKKTEYVHCKNPSDVYKVWDNLCELGNLIHKEAELVLKANDWSYFSKRKSFWESKDIVFEMLQFEEWCRHTHKNYYLVGTEVTLVDLECRFAGTADIVLKKKGADGPYCITDIKTCRHQNVKKKRNLFNRQLELYTVLLRNMLKLPKTVEVIERILQINRFNEDMSIMDTDESIYERFGSYNEYNLKYI